MAKDKLVEAYREAIEKLYTHTVKIVERESKWNETNYRNELVEVVKYENQPCRISFTSQQIDDKELNTVSNNKVKLFIAPEVLIKDSSIIIANINGNIVKFKKSTQPYIYSTHKEYLLTYETEVN